MNFAVLIVLPSHPANLTPPVSREGGDRENRCSRFGQDGQDCFDLGEAIRVGLLLLFLRPVRPLCRGPGFRRRIALLLRQLEYGAQ